MGLHDAHLRISQGLCRDLLIHEGDANAVETSCIAICFLGISTPSANQKEQSG